MSWCSSRALVSSVGIEDIDCLSSALQKRQMMQAHGIVETLSTKKVKMETLPPLPACRAFFDYCRRQRRMDVAVSLLRMIPTNERYLSAAISSCSKAKDWMSAQEAFGLWPDPNAFAYSGIISAANRTGRLETADALFQEAVNGNELSTSVCNAIIDTYCKRGEIDKAKQVLQQMKHEWGLQRDSRSFNPLIRAAAKCGDVEVAFQTKLDMQSEGVALDEHSYAALFYAVAQSSQPQMERAFLLLEEMQSQEIHPGGYILSSIFRACTKSKSGTERAIALFREHLAVSGPDPGTMSAFVAMCIKNRFPEVGLEVYTKIKSHPHLLDLYTATSLCSAVAAIQNEDAAMELYADCLPLVEILPRDVVIGGIGSENFSWNEDQLILCNSMLNMCGKNAMTEELDDLFQAMREGRGPRPDEVTFNTVIDAFALRGNVHAALAVFEDMKNQQLTPTKYTFVSILHACSEASNKRNWEGKEAEMLRATQLFQDMQNYKVSPDPVLYTALIDTAVKSDSFSVAFELFEEMQAKGIQPSVVTFGCLISACEKLGDPGLAEKFYKMMCISSIVPNDECHNILIKIYSKAGRLDDALELVKRVARGHGEMQEQTINSLIRALAKNFIDRALRLTSLIKTMGMSPSRKTYLVLIDACAQHGRVSTAFSVYEEMHVRGHKASRLAGSGLIESLCKCGDLERALLVYNQMSIEAVGGIGEPRTETLVQLTIACAKVGKVDLSLSFYAKIRSLVLLGPQADNTVLSVGRMHESLIEMLCRRGRAHEALSVFDDMKAVDSRISYATLAFLENCCRSDDTDIPEWRIYDICAYMRIMRESFRQSALASPQKEYHHGPLSSKGNKSSKSRKQ